MKISSFLISVVAFLFHFYEVKSLSILSPLCRRGKLLPFTEGLPTPALRNRNQLKAATSASSEVSPEEGGLSKKKRRLSIDFISIAAPALIQLAAEPLASLVDTAYLGRLGPEVLGGAGVAIAAHYSVSKLYNDPLLRTSISLVASQDGKARGSSSSGEDEEEALSIAVSSALLLACSVGIIQLILYATLSTGIIRGMGVSPDNAMWYSALSYLQIRSLGTPAATLWLVIQGIFRGLGDTRTPLFYSLMFTALNIVLDPIFIFTLKWGASGAAAGTALAQYAALVPLLMALNRRVPIRIWGQLKRLGSSLKAYLQAGSFVLFRTVAKVWTYSVCARHAALLGSVSSAAYNLTFQLGFATTQICEAVAVAVQTLLAREMADTSSHPPSIRRKLIQYLISGSILLGGSVALILSLTTFWQRDSILAGLTTSKEIQNQCRRIFPVVLATQTAKGLCYPVNGILMGGLDWTYTMTTMWAANLASVGYLQYCSMSSSSLVSLNQIWIALFIFMTTQVITGAGRFQSKTGVWKVLKNFNNNNNSDNKLSN
eukprot:CAMPEP_0194258092 /NCGR_PEP_ID=MMETSP0158-20130606/40577_1 /TAXON_ID=33649 /ORGANISM="Thalassionema nitzschioides, Strain L26-B" /LENGTH=543 /DNA_ID=CAMNT_0038997373 /DNA_START=75 /DNA_END=1706 /DNA_ORIENTATION=+